MAREVPVRLGIPRACFVALSLLLVGLTRSVRRGFPHAERDRDRRTSTETIMPVRIFNVRLGIDEPEAVLPDRLARILGLPPAAVRRWRILRKSLDARHRDALQFVYTAEIAVPE